jgi:hypothetical protein
MTTQLTAIDWRAYVMGGESGYFITRNIPLESTMLGQYRIEMSVSASGYADNVEVTGNYRIYDADGRQIADQRGIAIHYSEDLIKSAERWLSRYAPIDEAAELDDLTEGDPNYARWLAEGSPTGNWNWDNLKLSPITTSPVNWPAI